MEAEEVEFLEDHESEPSATNMDTPPAQAEWQWADDERDLVFNCHLVKEVYDNSIRTADVEDPDLPKRYNLRCWVYNKNNNMTSIVEELSAVSEEFSESFNLDVLESFLEGLDFLYENDTADMKEFTFSRPSDF